MFLNAIKSLFGNSEKPESPERAPAAASAQSASSAEQDLGGICATAVAAETTDDLVKFVDFIVRGLVDSPDAVRIDFEDADNGLKHIRINCAKEDVGKVVGKRGKTIVAIRSLVNGAAGRLQKRITLEVAD